MDKCHVDHVQSDEPGSESGRQSHGHAPAGFLILKCPASLSQDYVDSLREMLTPVAESQGLQAMAVTEGLDIQVIPGSLGDLVDAMTIQSAAITRLAESNEMLVQAMAESGDCGEDLPATTYMNGEPVR